MPLSANEARSYYDRLGATLDRAERFESRAKERGVELLAPAAGERIVELGVGTGRVTERLLAAVGDEGRVVGLDLSPKMLDLTLRRAEAAGREGSLELHERNIARTCLLDGTADALYTSYVLDLLEDERIVDVVRESYRILRPGGRAVFVGMTRPRGLAARCLMALWWFVTCFAPRSLGGCRPIEVGPYLEALGFVDIEREHVEQFGFPSEVVAARKSPELP